MRPTNLLRLRHDQEFVGVTPGLVPVGEADVQRCRKPEWDGEVAVQFVPPAGVSAALAGTVLDGEVNPRDLSAMMIDLSLRGYYRITREDDDWVFTAAETRPVGDELQPAEVILLAGLFSGADEVRLSQRKSALVEPIRRAREALYESVHHRGWYEANPRRRVLPALMGRVPRTALGTAIRIQTLGFQKYLATAEADQIKVEEAAAVFSRYLPYALVFGLADRWAKVVGDVLRLGNLQDAADVATVLALDPSFYYALDLAADLGFGALDAAGGLDAAGEALAGAGELFSDGLFDLGDVAEGVGEVFGGVLEVIGSIFDGL